MRSDLRELLPVDQDDVLAADRLVSLGFPAVGPLIPQMLRWVGNPEWPVAVPLIGFLSTLGAPAAPAVSTVLASRDAVWKLHVLKHVVSQWDSAAVAALAPRLLTLVTDSQSWGADLEAIALLLRHGLADPAWLGQWLEFKQRALAVQSSEVSRLLDLLSK
jgi:hypothetical protein